MTSPPSPTPSLWAVALTGPPARPGYPPEQLVHWTVAADENAAVAEAREARPTWVVERVVDHGPPRWAGTVDYQVHEPTPGIVMESVHAQPWPTHGSTMEVVARPQAGGARITYPGAAVSVADAKALITSLRAIVAEVESRGWDQ